MPKSFNGRRNLILLATFILCLPALLTGLMGDDYLHYALLTADLPIAKPDDLSLFGLFSFINGDPERNRLLMDYSLIPWWTYAELKYAFWRPLSEVTHWLDHRIWPESPWIMHLHNILWYLIAVLLLSQLYKHYAESTGVALLALFLYALDSSHGFTVSWISNRNALLALTFGLSTLLFHTRWREQGEISNLILALISMSLALFSAELGISVFGYLGAYALFMDRKGVVKGVFSTLPYFTVIIIWWITYKEAGFGAAHADAYYVDPASQPLTFLSKVLERLPVLLASQWGIIPSDLYTLSGVTSTPYVVICTLFLIIILIPVLMPQLRQRTSLFWLAGMLFSILPALAASPYDRLLLFPGVGAAPLLANFLYQVKVRNYRPDGAIMKYYTMTIFGVLVMIHVILAPALMPVMTYSTKFLSEQVSQKPSYFPEIDNIETKKLILISPPLASSLAIAALRFNRHEPMPARIWTITTLQDGLEYQVTGNKMIINRSDGFITGPIEESVRNMSKYPFKQGDSVVLSGLTITVLEQNKMGKPTSLELNFSQPVTEEGYAFLVWNNEKGAYETLKW